MLTMLLNKSVNTKVMKENNKNTEAAILEAADKLFKEKGFKGATTTMIAGQAGVTHAMLHYYFRTKEQIFIKVLDGYIMKMHDELRMSMSPDKGLVETVLEVTEKLFDFMRVHSGEIRLLLEIADTAPALLEKYHDGMKNMVSKSFARHDERLKAAIEKGIVAPVTMKGLICEIVLTDYSVFALMPMIKLVVGDNPEKMDAFLNERKAEAIRHISDYLRVR